MKNESRMYTKENISMVIDLWETLNTVDLAEKMGLRPQQVCYLANRIRLAGYKLPKKHHIGITNALIKEVLRQKKLIK